MSTRYLIRPDGSRYRVHRAPRVHVMGGWDGIEGVLVTGTDDPILAWIYVRADPDARDHAQDCLPWPGLVNPPATEDVDTWLLKNCRASAATVGWGRVIPNGQWDDYAWHLEPGAGPRTFPFVSWSW